MLSHSTLRQRRSQKTLSSPRPRQHAHPRPWRDPLAAGRLLLLSTFAGTH